MAEKEVCLIINAKKSIGNYEEIDTFNIKEIDNIIEDNDGDINIIIKDKVNIDAIMIFAKMRGFKVLNYGKTLILNKCFTGTRYALFGNNISHEAINKFVADDGKRYFFLCDNGKIMPEREINTGIIESQYKKFHLENAELISFSEYESGAKKKYAFIQSATKLKVITKDAEDNILYKDVRVTDVFKYNGYSKSSKMNGGVGVSSNEGKYPCVTFSGEDVKEYTPNDLQGALFTYDDLNPDEKVKDKFKEDWEKKIEENLKENGVKINEKVKIQPEQLSSSSMRQYVFEGTYLYSKLIEYLGKYKSDDEKPKDLNKPYKEEDSILGVLGKLERETYWSTLIAYVFQNSPKILNEFLGYKIQDYKVYNEEKNVDILIRSQDKIIVIENKINANINEGEKKNWDDFINSNELKKEIVKEINDAYPDKNVGNNQLQKYFKLALYYAKFQNLKEDAVSCYILCPEYKENFYENEKKKYVFENKYEIKTYLDLYEAIEKGINSIQAVDKKGIIEDIQRAINIYKYKQNEYYLERICGRFVNKIEELKNVKP